MNDNCMMIEHPLPSINEGNRYFDCVTNLSYLNNEELAKLLLKVNNHSINAFFNQIRRRIFILESPLVTSRNEKKSYIYANYNPKYAQYVVTILRTFYNFCWQVQSKGEVSTPAQKLGITDKRFTYKNIIYFK